MAFFVISLVVALGTGVAAYRLAERKGRSPAAWMTATVFLLLPLLVLMVLPARCPPQAFPGAGACG
ncbi:MAG: hypothetical protein AAF490_13520 [Chloroflexota bacterium]